MRLTFTRDELKELSERKKKSKVIAWLHERRIPYILDADGWPKVLRTAILDRGESEAQASEPKLRLA